MYADSGNHGQARPDKPCDGVRYSAFKQNDGLMRHHIDLNIQPYEVKENELNQKEHKKKGTPCGGKLYTIYHSENKHLNQHNPLNAPTHHHSSHTTQTLETKVEHYHADKTEQVKQENYSSLSYHAQQDIHSVEQAIYQQLRSQEYVKHHNPVESQMQIIYQRVKSEVDKKDYKIADEVAEAVENKYSKRYEKDEAEKKYQGSHRKHAKKAQVKKPEELNDKNIDKAKKEKTKNELDRHSLPSGLRPVQKRPGRDNRKGKKSRNKDHSAERSKPKKQQKVTGNSRKVQ